MLNRHSALHCGASALVIVCVVFATAAGAKGFSPKSSAAGAEKQNVERRLDRIEANQKRLEAELTRDLAEVRAELSGVQKAERLAHASKQSAE